MALQEIGPRFTLKLKWLKKGIPAVQSFGEAPKPLQFDDEAPVETQEGKEPDDAPKPKTQPPKQDEYLWMWKVFHHDIYIIESSDPALN